MAHLKELYEALQEVLREHGVEERYEAISSRLPDFIGAAVRGVPLDTDTLQPALDALKREKADLESRLSEPLNIPRDSSGSGETRVRRPPLKVGAATAR